MTPTSNSRQNSRSTQGNISNSNGNVTPNSNNRQYEDYLKRISFDGKHWYAFTSNFENIVEKANLDDATAAWHFGLCLRGDALGTWEKLSKEVKSSYDSCKREFQRLFGICDTPLQDKN